MTTTIQNVLLIIFGSLLIACNTDTDSTNETNTNQSSKDSIQTTQTSNSIPRLVPVKEAFDTIPEGMYQNLNAKLAALSKKVSAEEVVQMYYPAEISKKTSFEKIKLETEKKGAQTIVTLTHDNQTEHLKIQGHRIVMTLEQKGTHWQIISLHQQYKCWIRTSGALWSNYKCS